MAVLSISLDHIAALRQLRGTREPDPVHAAVIAELAGASSVTASLRDDRAHIQDRDVYLLKQVVTTRFNLRIHPGAEMMALAIDLLPSMVTFIGDQRETSGSHALPIRGKEKELGEKITTLVDNGIAVCLAIEPEGLDVRTVSKLGARMVELSTTAYARTSGQLRQEELDKVLAAAHAAHTRGLRVHAAGDLSYKNIGPIARCEYIQEITVGHALIARAALSGLESAVRDMVSLL